MVNTTDEVWAAFHAIDADDASFHDLDEGASVDFTFRRVHNQDGYRYVAEYVHQLD